MSKVVPLVVQAERAEGRVVVSTFFFFQAEDGIRDYKVTGVQTCALPISVLLLDRRAVTKSYGARILEGLPPATTVIGTWDEVRQRCEEFFAEKGMAVEIGRASCRERV